MTPVSSPTSLPSFFEDVTTLTDPTSLVTLPNSCKTTPRAITHDSSKPLVQYAAIIHAGPHVPQLFVYRFNNCKSVPALEHIYSWHVVAPPLLKAFTRKDAYLDELEERARSLDGILDLALRVVPESLRASARLSVKVSPGELPDSKTAYILSAVEKHIRDVYSFQWVDDNITYFSPKHREIYPWMDWNFLRGSLKYGSNTTQAMDAIVDLREEESQVIFEPDVGVDALQGRHDIELGGNKYVLYQHTHRGFGLRDARQKVYRLVELLYTLQHPIEVEYGEIGFEIPNPCFACGTSGTVPVLNFNGVRWNSIPMFMNGDGVGGFEACNKIVQLVLNQDESCKIKPCSFKGVHQPTMPQLIRERHIALLSLFNRPLASLLLQDTLAYFTHFGPNHLSSIRVSTISTLEEMVCRGPEEWKKFWTHEALLEALENNSDWCFDLTYMHALFLAYGFEEEQKVSLGYHKGNELLGVAIELMLSMNL